MNTTFYNNHNQTQKPFKMKNTKKPLFLIAFFACVFTFIFSNSFAQSGERIRLVFGTRSHPDASGTGCEGDKGICIILTLKARYASQNSGVGEISIENGNVRFNIIEDSSPAEDHENTFYVYEPKEVPQEIARELGYERIVIQPGNYYLNKSKNPLGSALLKAEMR
jgi:hypothetical protein